MNCTCLVRLTLTLTPNHGTAGRGTFGGHVLEGNIFVVWGHDGMGGSCPTLRSGAWWVPLWASCWSPAFQGVRKEFFPYWSTLDRALIGFSPSSESEP